MNADVVIPELKDDFETWGTNLAVTALSKPFPFIQIPFLKAMVKFVVGKFIVGPLADAMDLGGYFVYKTTLNKKEAVAYQDSIADVKAAIASGDKDAIAKARDEKNRRFAVIARLGNAP